VKCRVIDLGPINFFFNLNIADCSLYYDPMKS
jgi:hypothetical protein